MENKIKFIEDINVDPELDTKLRTILSLSFPHDPVFSERRYFKECPAYRWIIEHNNEIIAHAALHEKNISVNNKEIKVGGIAEVCIHPDHRGKGLMKKILLSMDEWMVRSGYKYAMLFGEQAVYSSSGYFNIPNEIKYIDHKTNNIKVEKNIMAMVKLYSDEPWPEGPVDLKGPTF